VDKQVSTNRYRLLTAACRHCRQTLQLGHCELCPMTEQRRLARQGSAWTDDLVRKDATADPPLRRPPPVDPTF